VNAQIRVDTPVNEANVGYRWTNEISFVPGLHFFLDVTGNVENKLINGRQGTHSF